MGLLSTPLSVGNKVVRGLLDEVIELYKTEPLAARKMAKRGGILDEIDSQIPRPKGDVSNAAALRAEGNAQRVNDADYKGQHSAPMSGDNAPLHDLSQVYPEDIYGSKGLQYYGTGDNAIDSESMDIINSLKGKPDQTVTMYRSVPSDAGDVDINAGDWVSLSESYVKQHGESALNGDYKIISKKVPASQLFTNGDSINEFGFDPSSKGLLMDKPSRMARAKEQGFDTDKKVYHGTADDFDAFDPDRSIGTQFWSTTNKAEIESGDVGAQGSGVIKEMYHRIKNPAGWEEYDKFGIDELIREGYDGLKLPDGKGDYTYVAFDPSQYRSVDAAFDPAKTSSSNLLASNPVATTAAGAGGLLAMTGSEDSEAGVVSSSVKIAKEILNLRAQGRASEVTNEMMDAADPQYMFNNTPLPMDEASRLSRANAAGASTDMYHMTDKGFNAFANPSRSGMQGKGVYASSSPEEGMDVPKGLSDLVDKNNLFVRGTNTMPLRFTGESFDESIQRLDPFSDEGTAVLKRFGLKPNKYYSKIKGAEEGSDISEQLYDLASRQATKKHGNQITSEWIEELKSSLNSRLKKAGYASTEDSYTGNKMAFNPENVRSKFARFDPQFSNLKNLSASNPVATTSAGLLANVTGQPSNLSSYMQGNTDAYLTSAERQYLQNKQSFESNFSDDTGWDRADILPFRVNEQTGDVEFATPEMIKGLLSGIYDIGQSKNTKINNPASLLELI